MAPILSPQSKTQQFLSFRLLPNTQAMVSTEQLTEVLSLSLAQIVPIPDVPPQVMGVCNWRGEVLWLVDLGYLLGFTPLFSQGYRQSNYSAIVLRHQDATLGLVVDQVGQMLWCSPEQIQPLAPGQLAPALSHCAQGYWLDSQGIPFLILKGDAIVEQL
ncbi:hypothetical protein BST81_22205 [Leptolyngbya sp. 'hensonii']|uniref:chemotaxis protein CheW n=1 Tax=Leptolyngbya sp. 'hensonii' TaxID=1922337 RepID=UPI00095030C8|nr:chemotaxis protein CheW [Leptolyngbya sp. 'hensonii']OLP16311.1 hypothetical protein BST81_22205 [Leptolyngbya sp. 'hensonii']